MRVGHRAVDIVPHARGNRRNPFETGNHCDHDQRHDQSVFDGGGATPRRHEPRDEEAHAGISFRSLAGHDAGMAE